MAKLRRAGNWRIGLGRDTQDLFGGVVDHVDGTIAADSHHQGEWFGPYRGNRHVASQIERKDATGCVVGHVDRSCRVRGRLVYRAQRTFGDECAQV